MAELRYSAAMYRESKLRNAAEECLRLAEAVETAPARAALISLSKAYEAKANRMKAASER